MKQKTKERITLIWHWFLSIAFIIGGASIALLPGEVSNVVVTLLGISLLLEGVINFLDLWDNWL